MSSANVQNTQAIEAVRGALANFAHQVDDGLAEIGAESRRMLDWLEHDRPRFWKSAVREAWDGVEQAKANLHRCLMYPIGDERPSCAEEREELKKAQARLAYCEEKVERLKQWCREVRHELFEYEGRVTQLKSAAEIDVTQAIAVLNKLLDRIAEYQLLSSGGGSAPLRTPSPTPVEPGEEADETQEPTTPSAGDAEARSLADTEKDQEP